MSHSGGSTSRDRHSHYPSHGSSRELRMPQDTSRGRAKLQRDGERQLRGRKASSSHSSSRSGSASVSYSSYSTSGSSTSGSRSRSSSSRSHSSYSSYTRSYMHTCSCHNPMCGVDICTLYIVVYVHVDISKVLEAHKPMYIRGESIFYYDSVYC